jgi:hypothetical protein
MMFSSLAKMANIFEDYFFVDDEQLKIASWMESNRRLVQDSKEWHETREKYRMTSSRVGAALGVDPYCTKSKLMAEMRGQYFPDNAYGEVAKQWGKDNEHVARGWLSSILGFEVCTTGIHTWYKDKNLSGEHFFGFTRDGEMRSEKWYGGSPDGLIDEMDMVCEIKCPFSQELPIAPKPHHVAQLFFNMACCRKSHGVLAYWTVEGMQVFFLKFDEYIWHEAVLPSLDRFLGNVTNLNVLPRSIITRKDEKEDMHNMLNQLIVT